MALGNNLKKKKLIPDVESAEPKEKKKPAKKPEAKKTVAKKKVTPKKKASPKPKKEPVQKKKVAKKKPLIKEAKPKTRQPEVAKEQIAPEPSPQPEPQVTSPPVAVEEVVEAAPVNPGLPLFIAQELHEKKKELREKYQIEVSKLQGKVIQFVVFEIGGESYAIDIDSVKEVVPLPNLSITPNTPDHIKGIANVRGSTYTVFDLATKFKVRGDEFPRFLLVIDDEGVVASLTLSVLPVTLKVNGNNISSSLHMIEDASFDVSYIKGLIQHDEKLIYYLDIIELLRNDKAIVVPDKLASE